MRTRGLGGYVSMFSFLGFHTNITLNSPAADCNQEPKGSVEEEVIGYRR